MTTIEAKKATVFSAERFSAMMNGGLPNYKDQSNQSVEAGGDYIGAVNGIRKGFAASLGGLTALCLILLAIFAEYPTNMGDAHVARYYHYLTGVLIMVFVGFGFLMTFLRRYALSAVGLNFGLSALMMIGSMICMGWVHNGFGTIEVDLPLLVDSAFCAAAGMITFGAVIGFASPTQLIWLLAAEVPIYAANFYLVTHSIGTFDVGGSITIHAFGAFYGLASSYFLSRSSRTRGNTHPKNTASYNANVTSMIGTIFLWVYWPSFNAALASAEGDGAPEHQFYVVCNTLISLLGACVSTFIVSALVYDGINMVHIQNATLAGGVAIGTSAAIRCSPAAALAVGIIAGILSTLGFTYASPVVERRLGVCDTCGVNNLHGMPGIFGGIVSAVFTGIYYSSNEELMAHSKSHQAGLQIAGLVVTLVISIASGLVVGFLTSYVKVQSLAKLSSVEDEDEDDLYEDAAVINGTMKED